MTRVVVTCGERIKVARGQIGAPQHAVASALPALVELVAIAIAVALRDVRTSALINLARAVADAALVEFSNTWIDVVTNAIGILVGRAVTTTYAQGVKLVAIAVAVASRDVITATLVDVTWSVADAASIEFAYAFVDVVADAI